MVNLCKCGCEREIIWKPHHKRYGTPKYISGHNGQKYPHIITEEILKESEKYKTKYKSK